MYEKVIMALRDPKRKLQEKYQLLHSALDILGKRSKGGQHLKLDPTKEVIRLVTDLQQSNNKDFQETVKEFVEQFTDCE